MIPNQWYVILQSKDVKKNKPTKTRRMGQNLVLWRDLEGNLICQEARCPHKGANLGDGRLKGNSVECPYHGFRFNGQGECVAMPCMGSDARIPKTMRIKSYPVREHLGLIWLWWGEDRAVLPEIEVPTEVADIPLSHATMSWSRPVNYTRYIESTLEFYHITFVHRDNWFNTVDYVFLHGTPRKLGLDGRRRYLATTKIANNHLEVDGHTLRYTYDHLDEDDPSNANHYEVTFAFPNMTHVVTKQFEVTAWFTPIDEDNTEFILRWYEFPRLKSALRSERLRRLVPAVGLFFEKWIQDMQDVRMIQGQTPKVSRRGASKFVAVDELNAKYVQMRAQLLREAGVDPDGGEAPERTPGEAAKVSKAKVLQAAQEAAAAEARLAEVKAVEAAQAAQAADAAEAAEAVEAVETAEAVEVAEADGHLAGRPAAARATAHA
ncbi:Rieske 2Fe-2S domain-containing protein [Streptomyces sp. MAR4 CNX-425]|uniref:Rieske 2Fe-2S domain-containing protein n=1 Tax=Streptomyces sp. MAR4 CNX-425 TaxID=3406343 RepID=UPI003B50713E